MFGIPYALWYEYAASATIWPAAGFAAWLQGGAAKLGASTSIRSFKTSVERDAGASRVLEQRGTGERSVPPDLKAQLQP